MLVAATGAWRRTGAWIVLAAAGLAVVRPPVLLAAIAGIAASRLPGLEMSPRQRARNAVIAVVVGAACVFVVWGGQPVATVTRLSDTVHDMTVAYRGGGPQMLPIDIVRSLIAPYPWVTQVDANWDLSLYPGNWVLICLYPTMLVGAWKLRGRTQLLAMLVIPILTLLAINSFASGTVSRQRSSIEPLLLILAVVGWTSSRAVLNRAAGALVMTALVAGVQSRSVLVAATVLLAAAVARLAALRMTETAGEVSLTGSAAADAVAAHEVHR
jgi:hypothetical protein